MNSPVSDSSHAAPLRVGFLSSQNYLSASTFSGTLYSMHRALRARPLELVDLGWPQKPGLLLKIRQRLKIRRPLSFRRKTFERDSREFWNLVQKQLRSSPCDVLFAPIASSELHANPQTLPYVYSSDATFKLLNGCYDLHLNEETEKLYSELETRAIQGAKGLVYPSNWAKDSALTDYQASTANIAVVQYGANLEDIPPHAAATARAHSSVCKLLLVGRDFKRKGGALALAAHHSLRELGINSELTIIGCIPPEGHNLEGVTVIPYLDKNVAEDRQRMRDIYMSASFLLFPTRADCSPISLCEAAAFALPAVSTNVGGIADIVKDGETGLLLSPEASGRDFAEKILEIYSDPEAYKNMVLATRNRYDSTLNWSRWAENCEAVLRQAVSSSSSTSGS